MNRFNNRNNKSKSKDPKKNPKDFKDDPDHYKIKSVDDKFNVFNRKLLRKAKRKGVKDIEKFMQENSRGKKQPQVKKGLKAKAEKKQNFKNTQTEINQREKREIGLKDIYNEEADKEYHQRMIEEDEREIRLYEKKLGMKKATNKGKNYFKDFMRDDDDPDDLFGFLDNITKKVKKEKTADYSGRTLRGEKDLFKDIIAKRDSKKEDEVEDDEEEEGDEIVGDSSGAEEEGDEGEEGGEFEDEEGFEDGFGEDGEEGEFGEEFEWEDTIDFGDKEIKDDDDDDDDEDEEGEEGEEEMDEGEEGDEDQIDIEGGGEELEEEEKEGEVKKATPSTIENIRTRFNREEVLKFLDPQKKIELERTLRGFVNRVAEGNIESIFKQLVELYNKNAKYVINELYSELLMKSCVEQPYVLQQILATNVCLLAALFNLLGEDFLADFIRKLIIVFRDNLPKDDNQKPVDHETQGERPEVFKTRNTIILFCFLYDFDVLNEDFMLHLTLHVAEHLNEDTISYILTIIQNAGFKIRQNSPGSIKTILEHIRKKFEEKKLKDGESKEHLTKKIDFIFMNINDLKHNKKIINDSQDRLTFLTGWLKRAVLSKSGKVKARFPTRFEDMIRNDFSHPRWWMPVHILNAMKDKPQDFKVEIMPQAQNEEFEKLEQVAVEQRFTSDLRKRIFLTIMSADDYVDATQKLLKMKLNKKQDKEIAIVVVESCAQEEKFNKYYGFLAENLIKLRNGLKYSFQLAFWDHFKQLQNYQLRKISNLAKLMSFLVLRRDMGVQALRTLELDALSEHENILVSVFFKDLFTNIDDAKLPDLFKGINENEDFTGFREMLKEFLQSKLLKSLKKNVDKETDEIRAKIKRCQQIIKGF